MRVPGAPQRGERALRDELLHALEEAGPLAPGGTTAGRPRDGGGAAAAAAGGGGAGGAPRCGGGARCWASRPSIGQEIPLGVWASVAAVDEGAVEAVGGARAGGARLLIETRGGEQVGFAHALIREALYAGIPALRRRRIHRRVGEVLAAARRRTRTWWRTTFSRRVTRGQGRG